LNKNKKNVKPIFILSLPRTGSTLLQRVLMSHSKISSFAEPHFLLPFVYANKKEGTLTNYSHASSYKAVNDVVNNLPNKENDFFKYLNEFSLKMYNSLSDEKSIYFLDKTPVYVWIIPEIIKIFPDAKFIFLFRNPIQVYASIISTFSNNKFNKMYRMERYLDEGFELLSDNYKKYKDISIGIKYEEFILEPEKILNEILAYLELDHEDHMLNSFHKQDLRGRSMDPTGVKKYTKLENAPLKKWKMVFNSRYRLKILRNYVNDLDTNSLLIQGYDKLTIVNEIDGFKPKGNFNFIEDFVNYQWNKIVIRFKLNILFAKNVKWSRKFYLN
jgi:sulfotransferase family protein